MSKLTSVLLTDEVVKLLEEQLKAEGGSRNNLINKIILNHYKKKQGNKSVMESILNNTETIINLLNK